MISPDLPITKIEDDVLNRGSFAQSLAQVLLQYSLCSSFSFLAINTKILPKWVLIVK